MVISFLLKKKLTEHLIHQYRILGKRKQPPTQPCTFIIPYFNMKLLRTPNNLTTLEYP